MIEKNNYELNDNVTIDKLKQVGFREVICDGRTILSYYQELIVDVDLFIEFDITDSDELKFDEDKNVSVIDDDFGQYFMPFYRRIDNEYVRRTTIRYNEVMNSLVNKNILKRKEKELAKQLKKVK